MWIVEASMFESCGQKEISCFTNCVLHVVKVWPYIRSTSKAEKRCKRHFNLCLHLQTKDIKHHTRVL